MGRHQVMVGFRAVCPITPTTGLDSCLERRRLPVEVYLLCAFVAPDDQFPQHPEHRDGTRLKARIAELTAGRHPALRRLIEQCPAHAQSGGGSRRGGQCSPSQRARGSPCAAEPASRCDKVTQSRHRRDHPRWHLRRRCGPVLWGRARRSPAPSSTNSRHAKRCRLRRRCSREYETRATRRPEPGRDHARDRRRRRTPPSLTRRTVPHPRGTRR